jgi:hypothetical protein
MKAVVRTTLLAVAGVAAPVMLSAPAPPHAQAVTGPSYCHKLARRYTDNPTYPVPMYCMDSMWMPGVLPRGYVPFDAPPGYFYWPCCDPQPDAPPPRPPGNEPPPPGDAPPPPDDAP